MNTLPFLLVGTDYEGDGREWGFSDFDKAVETGKACCDRSDTKNGPPWQAWEVWGNHPVTEEWMPLATSD
jgi:hypothetical protein